MVDAPTFSPCIVLGPIPFLSPPLSGPSPTPIFPGSPYSHLSLPFSRPRLALGSFGRITSGLLSRRIPISQSASLSESPLDFYWQRAWAPGNGGGGRVLFRDGLRLVSTSRSVVFDWREAALKPRFETSIIRRPGNSSADWPIRPEGGWLGGRERRRLRCCHGDGTTPSCCEAEGPGNPFSSISKPHKHPEL